MPITKFIIAYQVPSSIILAVNVYACFESIPDRHEGAEAAQDPHHHPPIPSGRQLRGLGHRRAHHPRQLKSSSADSKFPANFESVSKCAVLNTQLLG